MALSAVPSLSNDSPSTTSSVDTGLASDVLLGHDLLQDDGTGALVVPARDPHRPSSYSYLQHYTHTYTCLFHILNCHQTFTNPEDWKIHVLSHFRTHEPPPTARCPLCPSPSPNTTSVVFTTTPRSRAWDTLLDHIDTAHYRQGHTLSGTRPDFELLRYLYRLRIIGEEQLKVVQLGPGPGSPGYHRGMDSVRGRVGEAGEPFCAAFSWRRERRERGRERRGMGGGGAVGVGVGGRMGMGVV